MVSTSSGFAAVLSEAADGFQGKRPERPAADVVVRALLEAEKRAKSERVVFPYAALLGRWRLCFATRTRKSKKRSGIALGQGYYFPKIVPAYLSFMEGSQEHRGEISNQVQVGAVKLKFSGLTHYLGKKNLLAFDFTRIQVSLFDRAIYTGEVRGGKEKELGFYDRTIATLPFFAFFS